MALIKIERIECDVCKSEIALDKSAKQNPVAKTHQVIFNTEQTEGRSVKPYLSQYNLDLCNDCKDILISGKMIFGSGAMGHNRFWFNKNKGEV